MAYRKTYRGEFSNTLAGTDNAAVDQVVRVDIADTSSGLIASTAIVGNVTLGFSSAALIFIAAGPGASTIAETVAFFTGAMGKMIRVSGTPGGISDGDYIITNTPTFSSGGAVANAEVNVINGPSGTAGENGVTIEDITEPSFIDLEMSGDPLHISIISNDEDKFSTIKSKQATIQVLTNDVIDLNTFCEGEDDDFYVEIFVDDLIIFRGYLIIPDMQQEFMPNPNVLTLTATDNIGTLKDILLVDDTDAVPQFDHSIIKYIAWCLRKTGISQNINVINSVRHGAGSVTATGTFVYSGDNTVITVSNSDALKFYAGEVINITGTASNNVTVTVLSIETVDPFIKKIVTNGTFTAEGPVLFTLTDSSSTEPFYQAVFLDARTFEKGIGVCEDCYTVLTKILTEDCFLVQILGEYYIIRIDDMQGEAAYSVNRFDSTGEYIDTITLDRLKNIGKPDIIQWMSDDAVIVPDRAYKQIIEIFRYVYPIELICNIDFSRGIENTGITPDPETIEGIDYPAKAFDPECWTYHKGFDPELTLDAEGYVKKWYKDDDEIGHYLFSDTAPADAYYYWRSEVKWPIRVNDKFNFSLDVKYSTDLGGGSGHFDVTQAQIRLYGIDGSHWTLHADYGDGSSDPGPYWRLSDATWSTNNSYVRLSGDAGAIDFTQWNTVEGDSAPAPVSGRIEIFLMNNQTSDSQSKKFINLRLTYIPLINGTYRNYVGQQQEVSQSGGYRAVREKEVSLSDAPVLLMKGAFKVFNGIDDYILPLGFTDANHTTPVRFGELQAFAVWNQFRRSNRNFDGELDLMESEIVDAGKYDGADLIHRYKLTDTNVNTNNRLFMVLHYEMDFFLLEWKAYVASLYRTDEGKVYTDDKVFKYITA